MSRHIRAVPACDREEQIVDFVLAGRSTDACDVDLVAHAAGCSACAETLELARMLREDQRALCGEAHVPSAGAVWWRATIRARAEAVRTAGTPITLLQGIAAASAIGLFVGLGGVPSLVAARGATWRDRLVDLAWLLGEGRTRLAESTAVASLALPMLLAVAACLIVAPIAIYLATADEP